MQNSGLLKPEFIKNEVSRSFAYEINEKRVM
jgi:hypothetical protein